MTNKEEFYWTGMEPLEPDDEFFSELCGLIDRHATDTEERLRYLCALLDFQNSWAETYSATGALWGERAVLIVGSSSEASISNEDYENAMEEIHNGIEAHGKSKKHERLTKAREFLRKAEE